MKQKKKEQVNNKFNFDDEYIIGVSNSASSTKQKQNKSKAKKKKSKVKQVKKVNTQKSTTKVTNKRIKMNDKKRRVKVKIVKFVAVVCLFVGAGCFLCLSPNFNVQEIIVEGNSLIPADTIRSVSKIELYKNIFLMDKSDIISNIEKEPYVDSVKVSRVFPNKMKLSIKERTEKYLVQYTEGKYAILDGQGYVLAITNELKDLPVILGTETNMEELIKINSNKNRLCEADLKKLDTVANIIETCKNYEVYEYITQIDIADGSDIKLIMQGEEKIVYLGSCSDLNTRILYMKEILNVEKGKKGEMYINGNLSEDYVFFRENV